MNCVFYLFILVGCLHAGNAFPGTDASKVRQSSSAHVSQQCNTTATLPRNQLEFVESFIESLKEQESGDTDHCENFSGVYSNIKKPNETIKCQNIPKATLVLMAVPPKITFLQECIKTKNGVEESALMVKDGGSFYQIHSAKPQKEKYLFESEILSKYLRNSKEIIVDNVKLNDQSTSIKFEKTGEEFKFNSNLTVKDFSSSHPHSLLHASDYLDNQTVRVPPEMYELNSDQEFIKARNNDQFSTMLNLIFKKALKTSKGNIFEAVFISLLTTDVRNRGPCGAVFGLRGRTLVPRSIFDRELSTLVEPNHLDATQHFFGYALMSLMHGGSASGAISKVSKEKDYLFPQLQNYFQKYHLGDDGAKTVNTDGEYDANYDIENIFGRGRATERRRIDIERDLYYNKLGSIFASKLSVNKNALPSNVVNSKIENSKRKELGLAPVERTTSWAAFDPAKEGPLAFNKPDATISKNHAEMLSKAWEIIRTKSVIPKYDKRVGSHRHYEVKSKSQPGQDATKVEMKVPAVIDVYERAPDLNREELNILKYACEKTPIIKATNYNPQDVLDFCEAYKQAMQREVNKIWFQYHY